ncbi:UNVERIFIED_CONTAM: hypothetical protein Sindi_3137700 [Sesamum indicum]
MGIVLQGGQRGSSAAMAWPTTRALGGPGAPTAGRADIEGSKSNVAMNAWLPQASYPCGNFSDTSSFKFRRSKGSLGHAFTVRIRTGNQNQTSFYPSVPHEISVLVELILGHLRYLLTDVPPQPNSPPDNVFRPDRRAGARLGSKKRGGAPPPIHGISKITLKVVVFHFRLSAPTYPTPLKSFHKVGLESSSTGSSFPADSAKPVPLAVVSLDSRQGHRIPLVRTSSESAVRRPGKAPEGAVPSPSPAGTRRPALAAGAARAVRDSRRVRNWDPPCPALRANPFPEYDRGRRDGTRSSGFSRAAGGAPDTTRRAVLFQPAGPYLPAARRSPGKGSRQNGSVTSGKGLALRAGHGGPSSEPVGCRRTARAAPAGESGSSRAGRGTDWERLPRGPSPGVEQPTQNWYGQGESDCLIKTKHCDGPCGCSRNVISAQCSECQSEEIQPSAGKRRE